MSPARQPAQHIFGSDDGQGHRLHRPVDGCDKHQAAGTDHAGAGFQEQFDIGDMFDNFHVEDDIEGLPARGEVFCRDRFIGHFHAALACVDRCNLDVRF